MKNGLIVARFFCPNSTIFRGFLDLQFDLPLMHIKAVFQAVIHREQIGYTHLHCACDGHRRVLRDFSAVSISFLSGVSFCFKHILDTFDETALL